MTAIEAGILRDGTEIADHFAGRVQNLNLRRSALFQIISDGRAVRRIGTRERLVAALSHAAAAASAAIETQRGPHAEQVGALFTTCAFIC